MFRYHLRLQLSPTLNFEERLENMLDFCKKAKIDDVIFFIGCEELATGHITIEEAKPYAEVINRASTYLKEMGITVSLNPWMTIGHYDGGRSLKNGQNFRTLVGHDGATAEVVNCPLCAEWRKYYVELLNFYTEAIQPDTIWLEDDFRLHGHGAIKNIKQGCFCDAHMRLYNEQLGTSYDRETFVKLIGTDPAARKAYLDVSRMTMEDTLAYISRNVSQQKRFGLMTGSAYLNEGRISSNFYNILSDGGRAKPLNRLSPAVARQMAPQYCGRMLLVHSMLNRYLTGDTAYCVTEIENNPHGNYTKSVRFNKFQQLNALPLLLSGSTFSIFEFNGNGAINYERLAKMYAQIKPYLCRAEELGLLPDDMTGVAVLVNEDVAYTAKASDGDYINGFTDTTGELMAWLALLGINCHYSTNVELSGKVVAIDAQVLRSLTTEQIEKLFASNFVIINGNGVEALFDMGLNHLIDAENYECFVERKSIKTFEQINSDEKLYGITNMRATSFFGTGDYIRVTYTENKANALTTMMDAYEQPFGAGITVVGNTFIEPHKCNRTEPLPYGMYHPLREYLVKQAVGKSGMLQDKFFVTEENVAPYSFEKDGKTVLMFVNFCDDDYESLHIETDRMFNSFEIVTPTHPEGYVPEYQKTENGYIIEETLYGLESYFLLCK